jgi:hypothetical protein
LKGFKSTTIRWIARSCWKSFSPNMAKCGFTMLKSCATTVVTARAARRCPARPDAAGGYAPHHRRQSIANRRIVSERLHPICVIVLTSSPCGR